MEDWWRESSAAPALFDGEGVDRTDGGMRKTKEVITATSDICDSCHMAFYNFTKSPGRLPILNGVLAAPAGKELPQGIDRANITVVRHLDEALAAGNMGAARTLRWCLLESGVTIK